MEGDKQKISRGYQISWGIGTLATRWQKTALPHSRKLLAFSSNHKDMLNRYSSNLSLR
jgi:hypothetical protein